MRKNVVVEQQKQNPEFSPVVQQTLGKLNVRLADLMEQINVVVKVLFEENVVLRAKFDSLQLNSSNSSCWTLRMMVLKSDKHFFLVKRSWVNNVWCCV